MSEQSDNEIVYVGRPTKWGNPLRLGETIYWNGKKFVGETRADLVAFYRQWVIHQFTKEELQRELGGKDLCCWCPLLDNEGKSYPCHAGVLLEFANVEDHDNEPG